MSIDVSKELEDQIRERVARGPYRSAEEFLRKSIERADEYRAQIRAAVEEGTAQARRGELSDGEAFLDGLDADLAEREREE
jgi:Arc/MetJ-type ribon-helix-helix transcriptional regulator